MKSQDVHKSTLIRCAKHQKPSLISSSKSQKIWDMAIVPSQIWDDMDINAKHCLAYLIRFFSLLLSDVSLRLHLSLSLSGILATPSRHADLTIADLTTLISPSSISPYWSCHTERQRPPRLATNHWPTLQQRGTLMWRTRWPKVKTSISDGDGGGLGCGFVWFGGWDAVCWIL